jgi:2,3-bisphosphoglycerate-dependent phosphoglycerate mutase
VTVAGPRRIRTDFLHCRRRTGRRRPHRIPYGQGVLRQLHLVRHGQSTWNAEGRVQGQTRNVPLTAAGRQQARAAADVLRKCDAQLLLTSDLLRAEQSAVPIARVLGLSAAAEPALREQGLGSLEGRLACELEVGTTSPGERIASVRWGGGESVVDVHARLSAFFQRLARGWDDSGDVVLVTHADVIRIAVAYLRGRGPHEVEWFAVPNGSVTTVRFRGDVVDLEPSGTPCVRAGARPRDSPGTSRAARRGWCTSRRPLGETPSCL